MELTYQFHALLLYSLIDSLSIHTLYNLGVYILYFETLKLYIQIYQCGMKRKGIYRK